MTDVRGFPASSPIRNSLFVRHALRPVSLKLYFKVIHQVYQTLIFYRPYTAAYL
jgi:hypothetical protein